MLDRYETFRDCRTTIRLTALKVSTLYIIHCDFYRYANTQNQMCELCTFSQIRSHMQLANLKMSPNAASHPLYLHIHSSLDALICLIRFFKSCLDQHSYNGTNNHRYHIASFQQFHLQTRSFSEHGEFSFLDYLEKKTGEWPTDKNRC